MVNHILVQTRQECTIKIKVQTRLYGGQNLGVVIPVAPVVASLLFCLTVI